jgi:hypothetical protein
MHSWFIEEFIAAKGPQTLPSYLYWNIDKARGTIHFIHEALRASSIYVQIHLWLTCLHSCLVSIGLSLQERVQDAAKGEISKRKGLREPGRSLGKSPQRMVENVVKEDIIKREGLREPGRLIGDFKSLTEEWKEHREGRKLSLQRQPITTDNEQLSQGSKDVNAPIYQVNANDWSLEEWDVLQNLTNEVTSGLNHGYIILGPSEGWDRYFRDPDGMCAQSVNIFVRISSQ